MTTIQSYYIRQFGLDEVLLDLEAYSNDHGIWIANASDERDASGDELSIQLTPKEAAQLITELQAAMRSYLEGITKLLDTAAES